MPGGYLERGGSPKAGALATLGAMELHDVPGARRILAVSAHPDDAEFFAGGALAEFGRQGAEVALVVCTDGRRGGRDLEDPAGLRRREQDAASRALGIVETIHLGHEDGRLEVSEALREGLVREIRRQRPEIVLGHDPNTFWSRAGRRAHPGHSDHRASGTALLDAVYPRAGSPNFYPDAGDPWTPRELWLFDTNEPDFRVDVTASFDRKLAALQAHGSQQGAGGGLVEAARRVGALYGDETHKAEAFVRLVLS